MTQSLWGTLPNGILVKTPIAILKEQSSILQSETAGVLHGKITPETLGSQFVLYFDIIAPSLNYYAYRVLRVTHPIEMYPAEVYTYATETTVECADELAFIEHLGHILSSEDVHRILASLLAQSEGLSFQQMTRKKA